MLFLLKEWKEMYRSKIVGSSIFLILSVSLLIIRQMISYNSEITLSQLFVPLFQANMYFIPLLSMIIASFSIQQEKLQKTMPILLTRYVSPMQFFWQKSLSIHVIMGSIIGISYLLITLFSKFYVQVSFMPFIYFLLSIIFISMIFNQLGCFLGYITENRIRLLSYILIIWLFYLFIYDLILIYFVPSIHSSDVFLFSIFYFLSPINTMRYFLNVKLNVFDMDSFSLMFDHVTFHSPTLILFLNLLFYLGISYGLGLLALKKGGFKE
jgi:ABC-type transport system involved in multi-copper enzyme maturation permease subunit